MGPRGSPPEMRRASAIHNPALASRLGRQSRELLIASFQAAASIAAAIRLPFWSRCDSQNEKPQDFSWGFAINRATSYSPTRLRVQYHRG